MKKKYIVPRMEAMEIKMQGVIAGSSVTGVSGFDYIGGGSVPGRAPSQQEREEELDDLTNFDNILF